MFIFIAMFSMQLLVMLLHTQKSHRTHKTVLFPCFYGYIADCKLQSTFLLLLSTSAIHSTVLPLSEFRLSLLSQRVRVKKEKFTFNLACPTKYISYILKIQVTVVICTYIHTREELYYITYFLQYKVLYFNLWE